MTVQKHDPDAAVKSEAQEDIPRRRFLARMSIGLSVLGAAIVGLPMIGFIFGPLWRKAPPIWRPVGDVSRFKIGETVSVVFQDASPLPWAGVTANTAAWLRRNSDTEFVAYSIHCTHLGCPVRWLPEANLFVCPCHGGVYYSNGDVAGGPPPKPLTRYSVRVNKNQVEILTGPIPIATT